MPHPPQHDKSDLGLILLLAIGLPVLLLGGGRALYLVRTEADGNADASGTRLDLGTAPAQTPPEQTSIQQQQPTRQQPAQTAPDQQARPARAGIGGTITLAGNDQGLTVAVTVNQFFSTATPDNAFSKPRRASGS